MQLHDLPKTAAYREPNGDTIREMCERFNFSTTDLGNLNMKGEPWEKKYPIYMKHITGYPACPICNGAQGLVTEDVVRGQQIQFQSVLYCLDHPVHTNAITFALRRIRDAISKGQLTIQDKSDPKIYPHGNWRWIESLTDIPNEVGFRFLVKIKIAAYLGDICSPHNQYIQDCPECIESLKQIGFEQERMTEIVVRAELAK